MTIADVATNVEPHLRRVGDNKMIVRRGGDLPPSVPRTAESRSA